MLRGWLSEFSDVGECHAVRTEAGVVDGVDRSRGRVDAVHERDGERGRHALQSGAARDGGGHGGFSW